MHEISKLIEKGVKEELDRILSKPKKKDGQQFKLIEKLLFTYPCLKEFLNKYRTLDFDNMSEKIRKKYTSKRAYAELVVSQVEGALEVIKKYEYSPIVDMFFFKGMTYDQIVDELHCSNRTANRWKKRLVEEMKPLFFGVDSLEDLWE